MKLVITLASLFLTLNAVAGTGDYGSVGGARPSSVTSTSDKIEKFNSQASAMTIVDLCRTLATNNSGVEWGKSGSKVNCYKTPEGLVEIRAQNSKGILSLYANPSDKTVIEFMGSDEIHRYTNNLGQSLYLQLSFVNEGQRMTLGGVLQEGHYRPDMTIVSGSSRIRVGFYIQDFAQ